jgi:predicted nucleic acid-binding protein
MPDIGFLDSNVLVYAYQFNDLEKRNVAQELLEAAVAGQFVISTQVLAEFSATLLHKFSPPVSAEAISEILDRLSAIKVISPDGDTIRRAVEAHASYGLRFYDGMIVAAAERAGCKRLLSEDFNSGQSYFGIAAENPFK